MKTCKKCNKELPYAEFYKHRTNKDGYSGKCKICTSLYDKVRSPTYYRKNRNDIIRRQILYFSKRYKNNEIARAMHCLRTRMRRALKTVTPDKIPTQLTKTLNIDKATLSTFLLSKPSKDSQIDHICPLSQAINAEEQLKLNDFRNLQWLSPAENLRKSDNVTPRGRLLCIMLLGRDWIP